MKLPFLFTACFLTFTAFTQTVQWASRLLEFSSEYTENLPANTTRYKASQVLGVPNTPVYGISELAWAPAKSQAGKEYVVVGFDQPQFVQQVIIGETFNPGAVKEIILYDEKGNGHSVYENKNTAITNHYGQVLIPYKIVPTTYKAIRLKLVLQTGQVGGMQQIDCIGISSSPAPVKLTISELQYSMPVPNPENLGPGVNSEYFDHLPLISPDGSALFFTRKFAEGNTGAEQKDDIYYAYRLPDGSFPKGQNIGPPLNTAEHNFVCYIGSDNNTLYLGNKYKGSNLAGVSVSKRQANGSWGKPAALKIPNLYNDNEFAHYHFSLDERTLLMCLQRADSYGDLDIYISFQYADGSWSEPKNLGPQINTVGAEGSVFLAADGRTLYFSSTGHQGYGSYDMFMTKRLDNSWTKWSKPLNLGPRINSTEMDIYYTIPASGDYAYFSSGRTMFGLNDLYRIKLPPEARPEPVNLQQYHASQPTKPASTPANTTLDEQLNALKKQQTVSPKPATAPAPQVNQILSPAPAPVSYETISIPAPQPVYTEAVTSQPAPPVSGDPLMDKLEALKKQQQELKNKPAPVSTATVPVQTPGNLTTASYPNPAPVQNTYPDAQTQAMQQKLYDVQPQPVYQTEGTKLPAADPYQQAWEKPALKEKQADQSVQEFADLQAQINALKQQQQQQTFYGDAPKASKIKVDTTDPGIKYIPPATLATANTVTPGQSTLQPYEDRLKKVQEQLAALDKVPEQTAPLPAVIPTTPATETETTAMTAKKETETIVVDAVKIPAPEVKSDTAPVQPDLISQTISALNDSKTILENDIHDLSQQRDKISADKDKLSSENDQLAAEKAKLETEKVKMDSMLTQMQAEKKKLEAEKAKLDALKKQQEKEIFSLKSSIDSLKQLEAQSADNAAQNQRYNLFDVPLEVGAVAVMRNIYFVADAAFIQKQSYAELDKLVAFMKQHNTLNVEIGGHTNGLCDDIFCDKLSNDRAKAIVDYLVSRGIDLKKLSYKGYGKHFLIAKPGDAINQRVEIKIMSLQ